MFLLPKLALQSRAVVELASGLTLSSPAHSPTFFCHAYPLGALAPSLTASALNLTLMQSERPLTLP